MVPHSENAQLALDTINRVTTKGIPTAKMHIMEHSVIERLAGTAPGSYKNDPHGVYMQMMENIGICLVDQYIATNPLTMGDKGYENHTATATTGGTAQLNGILIDSPESVVEHMERFLIPHYIEMKNNLNPAEVEQEVINHESLHQRLLGPNILKAGYGHIQFPYLHYGLYGYENYFMAFSLYPEVMDSLFSVQADFHEKRNVAVVRGFQRAGLPLYHRLDHDIADSRGLLTGLKALERSWLPCFERAIRPAVDAGFTLLWHCDGNLMDLLPPLLECGLNGFQGFQYEDGMDYVKICKMKDRNGRGLVIEAGISVTRELPMGTPVDVKKQVDFLVENGPDTGLFLLFSSSCTPGTPFENICAAIEAVQYYRKNGRKGM